jgi:branched-chain amino acid aminotransferase
MNSILVDSGTSPQIVPADHPLVTSTDRGFTYGDGLFETIRVLNGQALFLNRHLRRLASGLTLLNLSIPWNAVTLTERIQQLIAANQMTEGILRLTITRGSGPRGFGIPAQAQPQLIIQAAPLPPAPPPATAILVPWRTDPASPLSQLKSLSALDKVLAKDFASQAGVTEALFINLNGNLSEATSSNIFIVQHDQILTPAVSEGVLPGITREVLIEYALAWGQRIIETAITPAQLTTASEAFLTNSVSGPRPLIGFEGQAIGTGQPGPITNILAQEYQQLCETVSQPTK